MNSPKNLFLITIILLLLSGCGRNYQSPYNKPLFVDKNVKKIGKSDKKVVPSEAKKNPEHLTFDQLVCAKEYYLSIDRYDMAAKCVEQMLKKTSDVQLLQQLRLEVADLNFQLGDMEQASKFYTVYLGLYPGSTYKTYAHYQAILCRFYLSLSSDRDQTKTHEVLILAQEYLNHAQNDPATYQPYLVDVQSIKHQCCQKLYESDLNIYNFYFKRGSYKACQVHLENMKKRFAPLFAEREPDILELECVIADKLGQKELLLAKREELQKKYPHHYQKVILAYAQPIQKEAIARF